MHRRFAAACSHLRCRAPPIPAVGSIAWRAVWRSADESLLCLCVSHAGLAGPSGSQHQLMEQVDGLQGDDNIRMARKGLVKACNASLDRYGRESARWRAIRAKQSARRCMRMSVGEGAGRSSGGGCFSEGERRCPCCCCDGGGICARTRFPHALSHFARTDVVFGGRLSRAVHVCVCVCLCVCVRARVGHDEQACT